MSIDSVSDSVSDAINAPAEYLTLIGEALAQYSLSDADVRFIRHNENVTCKCTDGVDEYLLRVHKPAGNFSLGVLSRSASKSNAGARELIGGELQLLEYLADYQRTHGGAPVQRPIKNMDGGVVTELSDGSCATMLRWLDGDTLQKTIAEPVASDIGAAVGKLHAALGEYYNRKNTPPDALPVRYRYDAALTIALEMELAAARNTGVLPENRVAEMTAALGEIRRRMGALDEKPDAFGIIHADLSPSNLLLTARGVSPIDFSLSGYGYYAADIGMLYAAFGDGGTRLAIRRAYETASEREIPDADAEPFFALGILLFIACQYARFSGEEWFSRNLKRWGETVFKPLAAGEPFITFG